MDAADAQRYLAQREIPQLFQVSRRGAAPGRLAGSGCPGAPHPAEPPPDPLRGAAPGITSGGLRRHGEGEGGGE